MELNTVRHHARSGTRWTSLSTVYMMIVDMAALMVLARLIDRSAFGLLAIIMVIIGFCNIFLDFGISTAVIHRQRISRDECCTLFWLNLGAGIGFYLLLLLGTPLAVRCYHEPLLGSLLPLIGLNILAAALGLLHKTLMQKELRFRDIAMAEMSGKTVYLVVSVVLAWRGAGVYAMVYGSLALFAVTNLWFFWVGQRRMRLGFHFRFIEAVPFLRVGSFQTGTAVVNYLVSNLDVLLIGYFFPMRDLGGYNLAKQLAMRPFLVITQVFSRMVGPLLSRLQGDREKLQHAYYDFLAILSFIAAPVFILASLWGRELMLIFYGQGFVPYAFLFQLYCLYMVFIVYGNPVGGLIIATGRTGLGLTWEVTASVLRMAAVLTGCLISLPGVVWCQLATGAVLFVLGYRVLVYNLCDMKWRRFVAPLLMATMTAVAVGLVSRLAEWMPVNVLVRTAVGLIGGLGLYWLGFLSVFRKYYQSYIRHWLAFRAAPDSAVTAE